MNFCKEIRLRVKDDKCWIEYEMSTKTNEIPTESIKDAAQLIISLRNSVDEWID